MISTLVRMRPYALWAWALGGPFFCVWIFSLTVPRDLRAIPFLHGFGWMLLAAVGGGVFAFLLHLRVWQRLLIFGFYVPIATPIVSTVLIMVGCWYGGDCP
jgi:hypothetical protein